MKHQIKFYETLLNIDLLRRKLINKSNLTTDEYAYFKIEIEKINK